MAATVAILLDGGFVKKKLEAIKRAALLVAGQIPAPKSVFPTAHDVIDLTARIMSDPRLAGREIFRIYFYDAPPLDGVKMNPISRRPYNFGTHPTHALNKSLQDSLAHTADMAVRRGETTFRGWKIRGETIDELKVALRELVENDLAPDVEQKGVDLRIGLDVATLSFKRTVEIIVLVSGDSDLVPAMKFARREGLRVYLDTMGNPVRPSLVEHSDYVFNSSALSARATA